MWTSQASLCWALGFRGFGALGGSWVVLRGVISPLLWVIIIVTSYKNALRA